MYLACTCGTPTVFLIFYVPSSSPLPHLDPHPLSGLRVLFLPPTNRGSPSLLSFPPVSRGEFLEVANLLSSDPVLDGAAAVVVEAMSG